MRARVSRLVEITLPSTDADAERNRVRARRKNRSNSSAIARIFPRTKAARAPARAAATGKVISESRPSRSPSYLVSSPRVVNAYDRNATTPAKFAGQHRPKREVFVSRRGGYKNGTNEVPAGR